MTHGQIVGPDGHPTVERFDPPIISGSALGSHGLISPEGQHLHTYADAARMAGQVVGSPAVMDEIRKAAGIDDVIDIDLDWLTLDEIEVLEQMTGEPFDKFMQGQGFKSASLRVLGVILKRRVDPHFPIERSGEIKVRMTKKQIPPTNGAGSAR